MLKQLKQDMLFFNIVIGVLMVIIAIAFMFTVYKTYEGWFSGGGATEWYGVNPTIIGSTEHVANNNTYF
jgi:hypothetical protein